jgi:extracellular elastinolytic metalloproteinase
MPSRSFWLVLVLAALTLALVPSAMPASDTGTANSTEAGPVDVALGYVDASAAALGVTRADVADLAVTSSYRSSHNGVTHVNLNQRFQGLEVFGAHATVNVASSGKVIFAAGAFVSDLRAASADDAALAATDAVEAAAAGLGLDDPAAIRVIDQSGGAAQETVLSRAGISDTPIAARLGWQPTKSGLRLAWQLVIDDSSAEHLWNATVDAATGKLLEVEDWTSQDSRAGLESRLGRSGEASTFLSSGASALSSPNPVLDGSSYRVFALPKESPNDGPRTLETDPADGTASPFGWHDTNGAVGPEFTTARGNNVHAYTDHNNDNAPTGGLPAVVVDAPSPAAGTYDAATAAFGPAPTEAGVQGAFVVVNDAVGTTSDGCEPFTLPAGSLPLIDRGNCNFTVKVKNAQDAGAGAAVVVNNVAGPPITMGGTDATITIPSVMVSLDNGNTIKAGLPATGSVKIVPEPNPTEPEGGPGLDFDFPIDLATEHPHDYWDAAVTNLFFWNGTIHDVLYGYGFDEASGNFQANNYGRGGLGGDYVRAEAQDGGGTNNANFSTPTEPTATGGVPRMQMYLWPNQTPVRDGDFDNGVIIHEYGHGVSNRLTGGPAINCLSGNEQAGEGWSDYLAITLLLDPALDDPDEPRGMGTYVLFQDDRHGAGIRPRPYTRDMFTQPFTYDSIKTNGWLNGTSLALPHGLGHGWAATLWDVNWDLIDKHGFNPNVYGAWDTGGNNRAIQYVIDGLKMQGCGPGLVVARAAIISAAEALDSDDECTLWAAFSRRGLGFSAVQGTTNRNDNTEAFDTNPDCRRGFQSPVTQPYGSLNEVDAGDAVPLRFTADGYRRLDVLKDSGSPFSRKVDCTTLQVPSEDPAFVTPRERPVATVTPGGSRLTVNAQGVFTYPWKTLEAWAGTCRELVLTRDDGRQHRAFFRFL